ncbi:TonB C-terminal domain-containing protein [Myxococcus llanfairpwllgwyngyllgogerychwyrndrobwllllantysiliogogogochensis]|uniref:TonB C-terminal domain-containing protein n=1 Tax=Myxococcus llanfairpwllgwyngyllgogerychwyrndrobwllllantysiliogogogochensis TaxID=2590453 RepID=UPI001FEBB357|nr:TonB C-terminal domain-containing protein [Myxococcus llanfairpwllgwyngyllgogerychwyrndrobwllllantysiliogogogochensis]
MGLLAGETAPRGPRRPADHLFPLPSPLTPGGDSRPSGIPIQSGRTLRPGDAGPSREALAAEERGRVSGRVQGVIDDQQATLRVANGLIDPYFSRLRKALEKGLEDAPVFPGTSLLHQAKTSWASQSKNYGATGNPGGPTPNAPTGSEQLQALQNRLGDSSGDYSMEGLRGRVQAGDEMQKLAGGGGAKLIVTLELHQDSDGTLRDAKLVTLSGNPAYDAFVLNGVPFSLAKLGAPPDGARGVKATGIHTLWSVEGRVVYFRKLKELKGQDSLYVASAVAAGLLAGRFEETTGEIEVIDFRNPRFVCQPRLLRVY